MKRKLGLATLVLASLYTGRAEAQPGPAPAAQEVARPGAGIVAKGIRVAINSATTASDSYDEIDGFGVGRVRGIGLGGFLVYAVAPSIGIQAELMYNQRGVEFSSNGRIATVQLGYVDAIALGRFELSLGARFSPYLVAGFSLGDLMSATAKLNGGTEDVSDVTSTFEAAAVVGGGVSVGFDGSLKTLSIEVRYFHGLINLDDGDPVDEGFKVYSRAFALQLGMSL